MAPDDAAAADVWSRLWRSGALHSCATGMEGNYEGAILAFWQRQFAPLAAQARVVDVGTGNGALLLLAADEARRRGIGFELHGIDVARIDPARHVPDGDTRFAGIRFHPGTPAQCMPFDDGGVNLLCSQFGFEYAPRAAAVAEAARVLAPGGRIALVMHCSDSIVATTSLAQRRACDFLRRDCPILLRAIELVPELHRAAAHAGHAAADARAEAARAAFNRCAQSLMDEIAREPQAELLQRVARQVHAALRIAARAPDQAQAHLAALRAALDDEDARLAQLQAALLDPAGLQALADAFAAHGLQCDTAAISQQPGLRMGWSLEARRG